MFTFAEIITEDFKGFQKQYEAPIKLKNEEVIDIEVIVTQSVLKSLKDKELNDENSLDKDSRFRFYLRFKVDELGESPNPPYPVRFYVHDMTSAMAPPPKEDSKSATKMFFR